MKMFFYTAITNRGFAHRSLHCALKAVAQSVGGRRVRVSVDLQLTGGSQ